MDEVKIIESSNFKSLPTHPQTENLQLDIVQLPPDIVWNLNLSPTASFLRELYK
jgi:hypothetical protein